MTEAVNALYSFHARTQFPKVPSTTPISGATCATGRPDETTSSTATARNSALNLRRFDMKQISLVLSQITIRALGDSASANRGLRPRAWVLEDRPMPGKIRSSRKA